MGFVEGAMLDKKTPQNPEKSTGRLPAGTGGTLKLHLKSNR